MTTGHAVCQGRGQQLPCKVPYSFLGAPLAVLSIARLSGDTLMQSIKIFLLTALVASTSASFAAGCLSGAAVGGVGGHLAGHHGVAGAAVGCAVGHHMAVKKQRQADAAAAQQRAAAASAPANR